jgi:hypothetical protein
MIITRTRVGDQMHGDVYALAAYSRKLEDLLKQQVVVIPTSVLGLYTKGALGRCASPREM